MGDGMRKYVYKVLWVKACLIASISSLIVLFSSLYLLSSVNIPNNNTYIFEIQSGDTLYKISNNLYNNDVIYSPKLLRLFTFLLGVDNNIQTGEYELTKNTRIYDLIKKISTGDVKRYKITILEGDNFQGLLEKFKLAKNLLVNKDATDEENSYINKLNNLLLKNNINNFILDFNKQEKFLNLDGLLYPDTYFYIKGDSELDIIMRAFIKLDNIVKSLWKARDTRIDKYIKTPYQALVLASILEKETSDSNERLLVSGVLYNRMDRNMPLQVDPTVIYALGEKYTGSLSKQDLAINSEYNTYTHKGLPPTPIGFVSIESLQAALSPSKHELLYFVAMGNGKHFFSPDLDTHNQAVEKYQKQKKESEQIITSE